jgi:hypothetical protein
MTRLEFPFVVNKMYLYLHAPMVVHWSVVKRIMRYLKYVVDLGMRIRKSPSTLVSFFGCRLGGLF